ncbi:MAG: NADH-quinone oxidoreductase subunit NuoF [Acidimicrobiaceae bacterium]|nr:NADH-quinone oxidoreductase subunit NuoF [Acidimicrobiaceae bacterium]
MNEVLAAEIIARFPRRKSAMISLLHLAQRQDGYVTDSAMQRIAVLTGTTPAEVKGTASFYEMFRFEPTGTYLLNICTNISCLLKGGEELLDHACSTLDVSLGDTTADGVFTLQEAECLAACTEAPCLQVNYRYKYRLSTTDFDQLITSLRAGDLQAEIPPHGTLARNRQAIPAEYPAGILPPEQCREMPVWMIGDVPATTEKSDTPASSPDRDTPSDTPAVNEHNRTPEAHAPGYVNNRGPKIITKRFGFADSFTLQRYEETDGYQGLKTALGRSPSAIHQLVKDAVLLGRGGAGFPAGVKWGFLPPDEYPYYLVVNGDESEPGTYKDRLLMECDPHQLIEGCLITCYALGIKQCFLYVRGEMALAQERITQALNEAYAAGYVGTNILDTEFSADIVMVWGAGAYIVGEETALIESLEGNRGMPRLKPPYFPAAIGLYSQPTIVNNVETLSNLPWLLMNGADAYKQYGSESSPGTRMFAVSGHVKRPGVYEIEHGVTTFRELIYGENFCQGIHEERKLKAFIPGGGSAPWFFAEHLDLPLEAKAVSEAGSMLGSGAVVVMDETTDVVKAALRIVKFFSHESCGKCSPCREGTSWMELILKRICKGRGRPTDIALLLDIGDNISPGPYPVAANPEAGIEAVPFPPKQTTICPLGPSAVAPVASTISRFREEYREKILRSVPVNLTTVA